MTPFGAPVEPDVYCRNAMREPSSPGSVQSPASLSARSIASQRSTGNRLPCCVSNDAILDSSSLTVSANRAPASTATACNRSSRRACAGG